MYSSFTNLGIIASPETHKMLFLVEMKVADPSRPLFHAELEDAVTFIEAAILPSLQILDQLAQKGKIVAGAPLGGEIAITFIIELDTVLELDELLEGLPLWPRMVTDVTPMTTFANRIKSISLKLDAIKAMLHQGKTVS
jgi:muconolactone delta-isomerase